MALAIETTGPSHPMTAHQLGHLALILADLGARTLVDLSELPVGIVTAVVGAPFFLHLLRRHRGGYEL